MDCLSGNLRNGIEMTQRIQLVPEKLQARRPRTRKRENIEDAAPQGDFAFVIDLRLRLVAQVLQPFHQIERVDPIPWLQSANPRSQHLGRKRALQKGRHVRDDHRPVRLLITRFRAGRGQQGNQGF